MSFLPHLGHGVGLRTIHYPHVLDRTARADWFEVISENFMIAGGRPLQILEKARELAPVVLHGVSLNIGGTDPLREDYLTELELLIRRFAPAWVSDHLCWGAVGGRFAHDLLPLPYTEEAVAHVAARIRQVQDRLGRRILMENVSSYLTYSVSSMPEWVFVSAVAEEADCGILSGRKQHLRQRNQPRLLSAGISFGNSQGAGRADSPGRSQQLGRFADRHSRPSRSDTGMAALSRGGATVRAGINARGMGRSDTSF